VDNQIIRVTMFLAKVIYLQEPVIIISD